MKLPLLSDVYPFTPKLAELHNGWSEGKYFKKILKADSLKEQIDLVNTFLDDQGFKIILPSDAFESDNIYEEGNFSNRGHFDRDDCCVSTRFRSAAACSHFCRPARGHQVRGHP